MRCDLICSFEVLAAVWQETFQPTSDSVNYTTGSGKYQAETSGDSIGYTNAELEEHSWHHWFNQTEYTPMQVASGIRYNSYTPQEEVIYAWMRRNDVAIRGVLGYMLHYVRNKLAGKDRGPLASSTYNYNSMPYRVPALMDPRKKSDFLLPHYGPEDLNLPRGCVDSTDLGATSYLATGGNWRVDAHSDWYDVVNLTDPVKRQWFPKIYEWYKGFIKPRISTGQEF
jgi:hypothetical protein